MKTMLIKPTKNFKLLGTDASLDTHNTYLAAWATNQPGWEARRLLLVDVGGGAHFLLSEGDYVVTWLDPPTANPNLDAALKLLDEWTAMVDFDEEAALSSLDDDEELPDERFYLTHADDVVARLLEMTNKLLENTKWRK